MTSPIGRAVMALALCCLDASRRDWASAMEAEFVAAQAEGRGLSFAFGCLTAAWRQMFASEEGWQTLTSYALILAIMLPMAALQIGCALFGFPYLYPGHSGMPGAMVDLPYYERQMRGVYQAAVPALAMLMFLLGAGQLRIAWAMLERDWTRVRRLSLMSLAAAVTLIVLMYLLLLDGRQALLLAGILAIELGSLIMLAAWRAHPAAREHPG
jgi:hypothetical protein